MRKESNGVSDDRLFDHLRRDERPETRDERDRETREPFFFSITLLSSHRRRSSSSPPCSSSPSRFPPAARA